VVTNNRSTQALARFLGVFRADSLQCSIVYLKYHEGRMQLCRALEAVLSGAGRGFPPVIGAALSSRPPPDCGSAVSIVQRFRGELWTGEETSDRLTDATHP
jgi:hypothetical protein